MNINKLNIAYLILFLLFLFCGINNYLWLSANKISPFWDESRHLTTTIKYIDSILESSNILKSIWRIDNIYPPLFYLVSIPIGLIWGNSINVLAMSNLIFLAILIFSVYKIGLMLFNKNVGLLAAFMTAMSPMVFGISRVYLLDFPVMAMVSLSIYLLIASHFFSNRQYSILFGLSLALGMLTKENFFIFLLGPTFYVLYRAFSTDAKSEKKQKMANSSMSFAIGVIISLPFYLKNIHNYFFTGRGAHLFFFLFLRFGYFLVNHPIYQTVLISVIFLLLIALFLFKIIKSKANLYFGILILILPFILSYPFCRYNKDVFLKLTWYAFNLKDQIGLPFLLTFLICLPFFLCSKENNIFLILWIILPYCFSTFCLFFDYLIRWQSRFAIPYLPAIAIISAAVIFDIKSKFFRIATVCLILILGLIQFFNISFGLPIKNERLNILIKRFTLPEQTNWWLMHRPVRGNYWNVAEILNWIKNDSKKEKAVINLLVNTGEINVETFSYYVLANSLPFEIHGAIGPKDPKLVKSDYVIILSNPKDWHWKFEHSKIQELYNYFETVSADYVLVKEFNKFNDKLYIYKTKND